MILVCKDGDRYRYINLNTVTDFYADIDKLVLNMGSNYKLLINYKSRMKGVRADMGVLERDIELILKGISKNTDSIKLSNTGIIEG